MTTTLPDFFSAIDLAQQSVQQVVVRNKYGAPVTLSSTESPTPTNGTDLISVSGEGIFLGGYALITSLSVNPNVSALRFDMHIDGEQLLAPSLSIIDEADNIQFGPHWTKLNIDNATPRVLMKLAEGITFEASLSIRVNNPSAETFASHIEAVVATV